MPTLTELIKEYKKNNNMSQELFSLLDKEIKEKSTNIFYKTQYGEKKIILAKTHKIEYNDIYNELWIEILRIIENFKETKSEFDYYLYATLAHWTPEIISKQSQRQALHMKTESEIETNVDNYEQIEAKEFHEDVNIDKMFKKLTAREREFVELCKKYPDKNNAEIALIMKVSREYVRQLKESLKNKLKKT